MDLEDIQDEVLPWAMSHEGELLAALPEIDPSLQLPAGDPLGAAIEWLIKQISD